MSGLDLLISQSALWYMLLVAVLIGALLGVLCDGLFIIRLFLRDPEAVGTPRHSVAYAILRGFCDALAAILATVLLLLLCYYTSDGQLRAPAVFGMIAGFWAYHKTVSRLARRLLTIIFNRVMRLLHFVWAHTVGHLARVLRMAVIARHRNTVTDRYVRRMTEDAASGFGVKSQQTRE